MSFSIFWMNEISNVIQIALTIILGLWGISNIILPQYINSNELFGVEQVILLIYFTVGIITITKMLIIELEAKKEPEENNNVRLSSSSTNKKFKRQSAKGKKV